MSRIAPLLAVAGLALVTACAGTTTVEEPAGSSSGRSVQAPREDVPSALDDPRNDTFPDPLIDLDDLLSGGPPPDGIPPIDEPRFEPAGTVDWLEGDEPVLSLTVAGETRAYPLRVMTWHEIVNDEVGGVPVAVTFCPLCTSGVAFLRTVADRGVLSFGTSGQLYADNLVMYDRQTESLWPQLTGVASVGALTGTALEAIPMGTVGWRDFAAAHPEALVLSQDTGFARPYGTNPYAGYDDPDGRLLFALPGDPDTRLSVKERVVGVSDGSDAVAVRRASLVGRGPLELTVGSRDVVLWHRPGQASALDTSRIADGAEIGSVGVFEPLVGDRLLHFELRGEDIVDRETGSRWDVLGRATSGPLDGAELTPSLFLDTFWFAWVAFHPDTRLVP
ncbi:DUF3179 domain-containing protein [uncultured Phycicoccus sp.]|uniref:DUF3179 domain-containing protein n=1 Tax=uncultured Phycicoccus sp. TaxID=661422 RepID=UPI002633E513|nr:DUF3179 domain-containing protein [uncultured Phycicoccus sp.]